MNTKVKRILKNKKHCEITRLVLTMDCDWEKGHDDRPNFAGFDVICIGLPGTGEISLKYMLSWLLQGACYDITK